MVKRVILMLCLCITMSVPLRADAMYLADKYWGFGMDVAECFVSPGRTDNRKIVDLRDETNNAEITIEVQKVMAAELNVDDMEEFAKLLITGNPSQARIDYVVIPGRHNAVIVEEKKLFEGNWFTLMQMATIMHHNMYRISLICPMHQSYNDIYNAGTRTIGSFRCLLD